ncbi:MAG: hypothetical protein ACJ0BI_01410 [Paracoccaceae bacterium]
MENFIQINEGSDVFRTFAAILAMPKSQRVKFIKEIDSLIENKANENSNSVSKGTELSTENLNESPKNPIRYTQFTSVETMSIEVAMGIILSLSSDSRELLRELSFDKGERPKLEAKFGNSRKLNALLGAINKCFANRFDSQHYSKNQTDSVSLIESIRWAQFSEKEAAKIDIAYRLMTTREQFIEAFSIFDKGYISPSMGDIIIVPQDWKNKKHKPIIIRGFQIDMAMNSKCGSKIITYETEYQDIDSKIGDKFVSEKVSSFALLSEGPNTAVLPDPTGNDSENFRYHLLPDKSRDELEVTLSDISVKNKRILIKKEAIDYLKENQNLFVEKD